MSRPEFESFGKIARLNREVIITEKIDGTNAGIYIDEDNTVYACSRKRWITPEDDNYGFAKWVKEHEVELLGLGFGMHWGEWWGFAIQRRYDLGEKRFSLFNTSRWHQTDSPGWDLGTAQAPECCHVVPVLTCGNFKEIDFEEQLTLLERGGSIAAPGFERPEGIVIFHMASRMFFKATVLDDDSPKGVPGINPKCLSDTQLKFPAVANNAMVVE